MTKDSSTESGQSEILEISTVLHGQQRKLADASTGLHELCSDQAEQEQALHDLSERISKIGAACGMEPNAEPRPLTDTPQFAPCRRAYHRTPTWESLLAQYECVVDGPTSLDLMLTDDLVSHIRARFGAPLRRDPWDRWDYLVTFSAALIGIVTDWFCAPIDNPVSSRLRSHGAYLHDQKGIEKTFRLFQKWLEASGLASRYSWAKKMATMDISHDGLPIDYCGKHFGGQHHRILSAGHDLLRFMSAIWQIKNGQFIGMRYEHGQPVMETASSQNGGAVYAPTDWQTAAIRYLLHVAADFFTETSLPIPGTTYLRELPNRALRKFLYDMYEGGYNLRHVVGQAVTPAATSTVVWLYYLLRYRLGGHALEKTGVDHTSELAASLKLSEMMLLSNALVAGMNVGRVLITKDPRMLSLPQITMVIQAMRSFVASSRQRYTLHARYERNQLLLEDGWARIAALVEESVSSKLAWPEQALVVD